MKKNTNPWAWVPTLYFAEGIPYVLVNTVSVIMFKKMGMSNGDVAMFTGLLYLPWVIKPLWSPFVDIIRTKRWWTVAMQLLMTAAMLLGAFSLPGLSPQTIASGQAPVSPFIATLGMMKICRSVTQQCMQTVNPQVPRSFTQIANLSIGGQMFMPIIYWLLIAFIMYWISKHTAFGRHVFAVGSNERASRLSGINTERVKRAVYAIMGLLVGCAAVLQVSRIGAMDYANAGSGYEMDAIAAVIVGGTSMAGGRGSISGTILGVLIIAVMNNLLNLIGVPPFLREAFKGFIVIAAVLLQKKEKA